MKMIGDQIPTVLVLLATVAELSLGEPYLAPKILARIGKKNVKNIRQVETEILDSVMGPSVYDSRIRPSGINGTDGATFVYVNVFVRSFSAINDVKMEYSFQITMRQQWNDKRLNFKHRLKGGLEDGWAKSDVEYVWKDGNPVQLANNLSLPGGFKLGAFGSEYCDVVTATGTYSCLRVKLLFARQLSFFIVTVYVPCSMTVSVSWMSFWLDHKAVPARVALGVTTLLAMSTTQASIQSSLPPVAYTKAIDVWSGVCVFFVFGALLEYAMVNYTSRSDEQRSEKYKLKKEKELEKEVAAQAAEDDGGFSMKEPPPMHGRKGQYFHPPPGPVIYCKPPARKPNPLLKWYRNFHFQSKKIDVVSRVFFPFAFALFNAFYWSYYLTRNQGHP